MSMNKSTDRKPTGKFDCPDCGKRFNHKYLRSCDQCEKSFPNPPEEVLRIDGMALPDILNALNRRIRELEHPDALSNEGDEFHLIRGKFQAVVDTAKDEVLILRLLRGSGHRSVCDYDESVRFRCEDCVAAESAEQAARERLRP